MMIMIAAICITLKHPSQTHVAHYSG